MKKILVIIFFNLMFCNIGFAETYYFKQCKLSEIYSSNYLIDFNQNTVVVSFFETSEEPFQKNTYLIELVTEDLIVTEKKQGTKRKEYYFQYFLDANSKSVSSQKYKKESGIDLIRPEGEKKRSKCLDVKADWYKSEKKDQEQILKLKSSLPKCQGRDYKNWNNCHGEFVTEDGYRYNGEWNNGLQNGRGIEIWQDGRKYVGEFRDNEQNGHGTLTYPDGSKYVGKFKNGELHGQGSYTFSSGKIQSGLFKNGIILEGTIIYPDGTKFVGKFKDEKKMKNKKHNISISSDKWVLFEKRSVKSKQLENAFNKRAYELCSSSDNFQVLEQKVKILEYDERPALSLIPRDEVIIKLGIAGTVECQ